MNRWNLGCRALLELAALGVMGTWGYENGTGVGQYVLMAGVPVTAGALWGIFAVQGDPSRSGQTVVPTPGVIRWDSNWRCAGLGTAPPIHNHLPPVPLRPTPPVLTVPLANV